MRHVTVMSSLLAIVAVLSMVSILHIADDYAKTAEVIRGFRLELRSLELLDSGSPSVVVVLGLTKESPP